jgi:hypothetical protein
VTHEELQESARETISPAWDYLNYVILVKLEPFLKMFRVAALINPFYVRDIKPSRDVYFELITSLYYFDAETVAAMGEIDLYNIFITLLPHAGPHGLPRDRFDTRVDDMKEHYNVIMKGTMSLKINMSSTVFGFGPVASAFESENTGLSKDKSAPFSGAVVDSPTPLLVWGKRAHLLNVASV